MAFPSVTYTFSNGTTADASQVNQNFTDLINGLSDGTKSLNISAVTAAGVGTFNAAVSLGSGTANDITFNGSMASTLNIKTTFSYDVGSTTIGLRDVYFGSADSAARTTKIRGATVASSWTLTLPVSGGTTRYTLKTDGSGTSSWTPLHGSQSLINHGLALSVASNILTIALKDSGGSNASTTSPVELDLRSGTAATGTPNIRTVTAAQSLAISLGSTLGHGSGVASYGFIYEIDSDGAGTMKLGASGIPLDEGSLQTAIAESFTGTVTIASPGVWTATAHGLNNNDAVILTTTGALPTGLSASTRYFVVSTAANTFQLSLTVGGAAINTTGSQSGVHTIHVACPRLVSDAVYSSKPVRLIGRFASTQTTAGTWATTPSEVSLPPFEVPAMALRYTSTAAQSITAVVQIIDFGTKDYDPYNLGVTGTWKFIAPRAGKWSIRSTVTTGSTSWVAADEPGFLLVYKNGSVDVSFGHLRAQRTATDTYSWSGSTTINLALNDYIDLRISSGASYSLSSTAGYTHLSIVYEGA